MVRKDKSYKVQIGSKLIESLVGLILRYGQPKRLPFLISNSQIRKPNVYKFVQNKNTIIKKIIKIDKRKKNVIIIYKKSTNEQGAGE